MPKIPKLIWRLETYCIERYFKWRSRDTFHRIDNSRLKGRVCLRCNDLFLKVAIKRHGRYFSFQNEMDRLVRLSGKAWVPRFRRRLERPRHTIFVYQYYEMPDLKSLLKSGRLSQDTRGLLAKRLGALLADLEKEGLVHRDITPANLLYDEGSGRLMLIDFQWARDVDAEIRVTRPQDREMLTHCLSVAGNRYRKPGVSASGFESDRFSVGKIISELEQAFDPHH